MSNLHQQQDFEQAEALKTQKIHLYVATIVHSLVGSMTWRFIEILLAVYDCTP